MMASVCVGIYRGRGESKRATTANKKEIQMDKTQPTNNDEEERVLT
jgi:hypothetical protein